MAIKPQDILPDGADSALFQGREIRKGTIKAAIENAKILTSKSSTEAEKEDAKKTLQELIPSLVALELNEHIIWKNLEIQKMFDEYLEKN